jgi:hypothetical protein
VTVDPNWISIAIYTDAMGYWIYEGNVRKACCDDRETADDIVRDHNALPKLVKALVNIADSQCGCHSTTEDGVYIYADKTGGWHHQSCHRTKAQAALAALEIEEGK